MIYTLLYGLRGKAAWLGWLNVLRYIPFRTIMATITAMLLSFVLAPWFIRELKRKQIGQIVRTEGPATHHVKAGTPTMGGALILLSLLLPTALWSDLRNPFVLATTAVTVGSGGIGGVFTPTLFVGAALGALLGGALASVLPGKIAPFGAYALVGMGGLVAGTTHAPIMAILMVSELTEGYKIVLPLMLTCIVASLVARRIHGESIYSERLRKLGVDPGWGIEELALRYLQARDVMRMDVPVVGESTAFSRVLGLRWRLP